MNADSVTSLSNQRPVYITFLDVAEDKLLFLQFIARFILSINILKHSHFMLQLSTFAMCTKIIN